MRKQILFITLTLLMSVIWAETQNIPDDVDLKDLDSNSTAIGLMDIDEDKQV